MVSSFIRLRLEGRLVSVSYCCPTPVEAGHPGTPYLLPIGLPAAGQLAKLMPFTISITSDQDVNYFLLLIGC